MNPHLRGPMRVAPFSESKRPIAQRQMLEGYVCTGEFGIDQLLDTISQLQSEHPGTHLIASLDDFQASYTSFHASDKYNLESENGHDLSQLPPSCFDDEGEYLAEFSTREEFEIFEKNFRKQLTEIPYKEICARLRKFTPQIEDKTYWGHCEDMSQMLDGEARILAAPFDTAHEALIAFPNGYFQGDLTPFENFELARHLDERNGLKLFGVGSSYLAFAPSRGLTKEDVDSLLYLLGRTGKEAFEDRLTDWVNEHRYLLVPYSEGLV